MRWPRIIPTRPSPAPPPGATTAAAAPGAPSSSPSPARRSVDRAPSSTRPRPASAAWTPTSRTPTATNDYTRFDLKPGRAGALVAVGDAFYFVCTSGIVLKYRYAPLLMGHEKMRRIGHPLQRHPDVDPAAGRGASRPSRCRDGGVRRIGDGQPVP